MLLQATYLTPAHQAIAEAIVKFFAANHEIDAALLVNPRARGKPTRDSYLDIIALAKPELPHSTDKRGIHPCIPC